MLQLFAWPRHHLLWSGLLLLIGVPALAGILSSANDWRVEATLRLRAGNVGALEQSARMCGVVDAQLPGVIAGKQALRRTALARQVATVEEFDEWLAAGHTSVLKLTPHATPEFCQNFASALDMQNRFWKARADRWHSDASGF